MNETCVHIVHPDGRIIPFDTFNMFYRDDREKLLRSVRGEADSDQTASLTVAGRSL